MKTVRVHFILDKSGSMELVRNATISGFNEYISTLNNDDAKYEITLTVFDTEVTKLYEKAKPKDILLSKEEYVPSGMTALYDAACSALKKIKGGRVKNVVVIMTDGEENSSKEYTEKDFQEIVKKLDEKKNWTFVYLGANQDSWAVAQRFGFERGNVANIDYTPDAFYHATRVMAASTMAFARSDSDSTTDFLGKKGGGDDLK